MEFNLSDFNIEENKTEETNPQFSLSDFGIEEEIKVVSPEVQKVNNEFNLKRKQIDDAKSNIDTFGYDDETKQKVLDRYNAALDTLNKDEQSKIKELSGKGKIVQTDTKSYSALERHLALLETTARGATRPVLGLLRIGEGITDAIGLTDNESSTFKQWIIDNEKEIIKVQEESNLNTSMDFADLGQIAIELAPPALAMKIVKGFNTISNLGKISAIEAGTVTASQLGTAEEIDGEIKATTPTEAVTSGALTGATVLAGGYVINKLLDSATGISKEAKILASRLDMDAEEVKQVLNGVPLENQAKVLANRGGSKTRGLYKQAVADSDKTRIELGKDIQSRTDEIDKAIIRGEAKDIEDTAKVAYKNIERVAKNSGINLDLSDLTNNVNLTKKTLINETAINRINNLANDLNENPIYSLDRVVSLREDVNQLMRKAKGDEYGALKKLKKNIDKKIDTIPDEYNKYIKDSIGLYSRAMRQKDLVDIIDKATIDVDGVKAVDYKKALKLINKADIESPEVKQTVELLNDFATKFINDKSLVKETVTKGTSEKGGVLGVAGMLANFLKTKLIRFGEYGEDIAIQKSIRESIRNSKTPLEFTENIIKNNSIVKDIRQELYDQTLKIRGISQSQRNKLKALAIRNELTEASIKQSKLGMQSSYGGKATRPRQGNDNEDYADRLFNRPKEKEEFIKEVNRLGITGSDKPTKVNNNAKEGAREWFDSLTNKQKEQVVEIVEKERDLSSGYGLNDLYKENLNKATKSKQGTASYTDVSDSLFGTKTKTEVDKSGNLGMTSDYGGKATGTGGVNNAEAKKQLNEFMDDIANPKVEINQEYVSKMYSSLKDEEKLMYGFSAEKKKAYAKLRQTISELSKKGSKMKASDVDKVKKDIEDYLKHFD